VRRRLHQRYTAVTADTTALAAAQSNSAKASAAVADVQDKAWATYSQTPEWTTAQSNADQAQADVDTARQGIKDRLANDPDYQAAVAAQQKAQADLDTAKAGDDPTPDTLMPLANAVLDQERKVNKMESDAADSDDTYRQAKAKLDDANAKRQALKDQFQTSLMSNADYVAAKKSLDDAQKAVAAAQQKLAADSKTAE